MQAMRAVDRWPRGNTYVRRFTVLEPDETGDLVPMDLTDWQTAVVTGVEGVGGTRPPFDPATGREAVWAVAGYDSQRGGAAEGAMIVTVVEDALDLDREFGEEVSTIRWTVKVFKGPQEALVVANVVVTVIETALR